MVAQGEHIETFEAGPNILVTEQNNGVERMEVFVEHDTLMGETDEIELSIHYYKNGQQVSLPVVPRLTFSLQEEKDVWRLTEITAAAHIPLTDPDYLRGLRKQQDESNEGTAQHRLNMMAAAENAYAAKHPDRGYACTLATLAAQDPNGGSAEGASFYLPGQGNEEWNGYRFTFSGCEGTPVSKYRITAVPVDPDSEMKTFCADESGKTKFVKSGKPSTCFSRGQSVDNGSTTSYTIY